MTGPGFEPTLTVLRKHALYDQDQPRLIRTQITVNSNGQLYLIFTGISVYLCLMPRTKKRSRQEQDLIRITYSSNLI